MIRELVHMLLTNKYMKDSIPVITFVLLIWLIGTLFIIMQDYKYTIMILQNSLTNVQVEIKVTQQKIQELQLMHINTQEYFLLRRGDK